MVYAVASLVLLGLVGTLALTSRQAEPPTIAEFAPQAVEQITDSAGGGSASSGAGAGGQLQGDIDPATGRSSDAATVDVARVRQCVGDPPRQTEDPQSPPCVPFWAGDNGGTTWKGVTRDEIRIAATFFPNAALDRFFNARFEFYGRKLHFIETASDFGDCTPAAQEGAAVAADEQRNVFASLPPGCGDSGYNVALARRGIVSTAFEQEYTEALMQSRAPYMWMYEMAQDAYQVMVGDWACARFAGGMARYAKGPEALRRRVFGIFSNTWRAEDTPPSTMPLRQRLAGCGERSAATFEISGTVFSAGAGTQASFANVALQMREAGVTTIFCVCHVFAWGQLGSAAMSNGYFPEWLVGSYWPNDNNYYVSTFGPPEQRAQAMGLTIRPRQTKMADHPWYWAESEGDPAAAAARTGTTGDPHVIDFPYRQRLVLASGIQMAGPHLTPESFERGLHRAVFPNPEHALKAGRVGFVGGDHSMTEDAAEYWWSDTDRGPYSDNSGTICYLDHGERRTLGGFPGGDEPFFKAPCYSGA